MSCSEHGFSYPGRRRESQASCSWSYVANYCCKLFNIKNEKSFLILIRNFIEFLKNHNLRNVFFSNATRQKILSSDRKNSIFLITNKKIGNDMTFPKVFCIGMFWFFSILILIDFFCSDSCSTKLAFKMCLVSLLSCKMARLLRICSSCLQNNC